MKNQISKINEKIYHLFTELENIQDINHDFDTRDGKIVANIKVYDWLDSDDVQNKIDLYPNLSDAQKEVIKEEFNEDRLNSIYNHTCETEVDYLKDKYESNVDLTDYEKVFKTYYRAHNGEGRTKDFYLELYPKHAFYTNEYWDICAKFKTIELFRAHIKKQDGACYQEWEKRNKIDKFECWQYGRSGGWFSICDEDETKDCALENYGYWIIDELTKAYNKDDNKAFNIALQEAEINKKTIVSELEGYLKRHNDKIEAIQCIVDDIEGSTKYFKESLIDRLEMEIDTFVSEELEGVNLLPNCTIKIEKDLIKTSKGVTVYLSEFKTNLSILLPKFQKMVKDEVLKIDKKVGDYLVEYATKTENDIIVKAGCHKFSLNNILQTV